MAKQVTAGEANDPSCRGTAGGRRVRSFRRSRSRNVGRSQRRPRRSPQRVAPRTWTRWRQRGGRFRCPAVELLGQRRNAAPSPLRPIAAPDRCIRLRRCSRPPIHTEPSPGCSGSSVRRRQPFPVWEIRSKAPRDRKAGARPRAHSPRAGVRESPDAAEGSSVRRPAHTSRPSGSEDRPPAEIEAEVSFHVEQ